ncbi:hypothetical protein PTTW11_01351 [Pyrenophora teres f. teres]|uniref:Heterokaryon incompatibility domain-containing protein n=1 Tax=Pyrenophora teres f. teres TaxID=97479 RepID=A0A6S6VHX9_9PLEO|nr:hypothetical protein PTTW11_01351 [Pyrenophora teres f. teres]
MHFTHPVLPMGVDALRILNVRPGDFLSPLVGTLTSIAFKDKPKYMALSYTWGYTTSGGCKASFYPRRFRLQDLAQ